MRVSRLLVLSLWLLPFLVASAQTLPRTSLVDPHRTIDGSRYTDVAGNALELGHSQPAAMAFVFINTECPISNKLVPELNRLAALAAKNRLEFYGVLSDPSVTRAQAQKHSKDYQIAFPVIFDASGTLAAALQPAVTPQAFVVDAKGKVLYSGRINDSYAAVGTPKSVTTSNDLQDAVAAVGAGKAIKVATTPPVGCIFESWKREDTTAKVTWSRDIAPLVFANCTACHHEGEVAPFSLMTYKDAAKRAEMLAGVTETKLMPPWKAADSWGTFHDERRLTPEQIALFQKWAAAGAPEGDKADAPPTPQYTTGWELGKPDMVVKMARPFQVPAEGRDTFVFSVIPLNLPADTYVTAFEYHPGNRKVVHHMIAYLDSSGAARKLAKDKGDGSTYVSFGGPGFTPAGSIGGWAPGATPRFLPEGVGHPLKKGSDLVMNIHYHADGKPETDQGEIALYFAKKPVQQVAVTFPLTNRLINIPPGESNYIRTATIVAPLDLTLRGITPHMHMLGREMKVTATFPDGRTQQLIYVNDWDWNWQDQYQYAMPIKLPKGTKVDLWARYDNSKDNPRNPQNPPQRVLFGEQTTSEMCFAFLELTVDGLRAPLLQGR
ncbi:MAG TPA: redoxin domain-containing protein [Phycisphaerae bacterium]|nr:redoxin domain-containing protein [Phycisphaerae bacterium]